MDRVLEIGGVAAGYCGRLFAQQGADVVRLTGHDTWPGWVSDKAADIFLHAGKRCVSGVDKQTLAKLANAADVVICEAATADAAKVALSNSLRLGFCSIFCSPLT